MHSEEGKKQQAKVLDLLPIANQLGCTAAQLAIGETGPAWPLPACNPTLSPSGLKRRPFSSSTTKACVLPVPISSVFSLLASAWCLRSEGVSSVLLGVSNAEQLIEHLGALQVSR